MILSREMLEAITGKKRPSAQARELAVLGVPFRKRTDGTLVVFSADVGAKPGAKPTVRLKCESANHTAP